MLVAKIALALLGGPLHPWSWVVSMASRGGEYTSAMLNRVEPTSRYKELVLACCRKSYS